MVCVPARCVCARDTDGGKAWVCVLGCTLAHAHTDVYVCGFVCVGVWVSASVVCVSVFAIMIGGVVAGMSRR